MVARGDVFDTGSRLISGFFEGFMNNYYEQEQAVQHEVSSREWVMESGRDVMHQVAEP